MAAWSATTLVGLSPAAACESDGAASSDGLTAAVDCSGEATPGPPVGTVPGQSPYVWVEADQGFDFLPFFPTCAVDQQTMVLLPRADPGALPIDARCDDLIPGTPPPPILDTSFFDESLFDEVTVTVNPHHWALVNQDIWAWHEGATSLPPARVRTTDLRDGSPVEVTVTAQIVEYCFTFDDDRVLAPFDPDAGRFCTGPNAQRSRRPGRDNQNDAAARHVYRQPGTVTVTHEQRWTGTATIAGPGGTTTTPLGPVVRRQQRTYDVRELHAQLTG